MLRDKGWAVLSLSDYGCTCLEGDVFFLMGSVGRCGVLTAHTAFFARAQELNITRRKGKLTTRLVGALIGPYIDIDFADDHDLATLLEVCIGCFRQLIPAGDLEP